MLHGRGPGCLLVAARGCLVVDSTPFLSPITLSLSCSPGPPGPAVGVGGGMLFPLTAGWRGITHW